MKKEYTVRLYQASDFLIWNTFISHAKNATFLFHRQFMEYHSDRFIDFSMLVFDEKQKLVAVLPANRVQNAVHSHQGLTYGGLVLSKDAKLYDTIFVFRAVLQFLNQNKIEQLFLKTIPTIYCDYPSDEVNYLMHICQAKNYMKHNVSVISLQNKVKPSRVRLRGIEKGIKNELKVVKETAIDEFWNTLLIPNLAQKFNSAPVHTLTEIKMLLQKFPNNIHHYNVYKEKQLVAGITLFVNKKAVKSQYISGCELDNELGSLDFLTQHVIDEYANKKMYLDFGPSHVNNGLQIVGSLNYFKESFGAHSVVQDFFQVETNSFPLLDTVLI